MCADNIGNISLSSIVFYCENESWIESWTINRASVFASTCTTCDWMWSSWLDRRLFTLLNKFKLLHTWEKHAFCVLFLARQEIKPEPRRWQPQISDSTRLRWVNFNVTQRLTCWLIMAMRPDREVLKWIFIRAAYITVSVCQLSLDISSSM